MTIYAKSLSRGGFFVQRLAAELSHRIAAVAAVGATLPIPVQKQQMPRGEKKAVGVMVMMGTADQVVAHAGKNEAYLSAEASYDYWIQSNTGKTKEAALESSRLLDRDTKDDTQARVFDYQSGSNLVSLISVQDGGHTWPGADAFNIGLPLGKTSKDFDANTVMWSFFQKHRR